MLLKPCCCHKLPWTKSTCELGFHPLRRLWHWRRTRRKLLPVLPIGQSKAQLLLHWTRVCPAPKFLFTEFTRRGGTSSHHIGKDVAHECIDVPMISPHVSRHLLKPRGPESTKYAALREKIAQRTILYKWFKVSSIIVFQQPGPEVPWMDQSCYRRTMKCDVESSAS